MIGGRLSEILTLRWTYVDASRRLLILPDSKTGQKMIQVSDATLALLQMIPRAQGNPNVIIGHRTGQPIATLIRSVGANPSIPRTTGGICA